jgi:hypothetical protein
MDLRIDVAKMVDHVAKMAAWKFNRQDAKSAKIGKVFDFHSSPR